MFQGGKGRGAASSESKRMSKLPPRLAKQKLEKEKEKQQHKDAIEVFMPKIEAWDNELANNIPPPAAIGVPEPPKGENNCYNHVDLQLNFICQKPAEDTLQISLQCP